MIQHLKFARRFGPELLRRYRADSRRVIAPAPRRPHPELWPDRGLFAAWLGHSSVLIKIDGFTILTDPVLGDRCGLTLGPVTVGLRRLVAPALSVPELPRLDAILLSHAHMDHFDIRTLRRLENAGTTVVTASRTSDLLRARRYRHVQELRWQESVQVGPVRIEAVEVRHWGARMRSDTYRGYNGYLIEGGGRRVVFAGDTAATRTFARLRSSRPVDLAVLPIGAYNPWAAVHCNPEEAVAIADDCGAAALMPVHHQTFELSREPYYEPIERFTQAADGRIVVSEIGGEWAA